MSDAYRWFLIAAQQGGPEAEKLLRTELKHARTNLAPTEQTAVEKSAAKWLIAHPHQDAYKILGGLQSAYYPVDEVYTTEVAQEKSSQGATAH